MAKKILIAVAVLLVVLMAVVISRPDTFRIERSQDIAAPAAIVYGQIIDFHNWAKFSPWEKLDPNMKKTFEGPESGVGAIYSWEGDETGSGRMTVAEGTPPTHVGIALDFLKPFEAHNKADFNLQEVDATHCKVTWAMTGANNFVSKLMQLFMDMDATIGADFARGLADLKTVSEERAAAQAQAAAAAAPPPLAPAPPPSPSAAPK